MTKVNEYSFRNFKIICQIASLELNISIYNPEGYIIMDYKYLLNTTTTKEFEEIFINLKKQIYLYICDRDHSNKSIMNLDEAFKKIMKEEEDERSKF